MSQRTMVLPRGRVVKIHRPTGTWWPVAVLIVALVSACNGPSTPTPTPPPPPGGPSPTLVRYQVSGIVTDETGSPIAGASVSVDYSRGGEFSSPSSFCPHFCWLSTVTNDGGYYEVVFEPGLGPVFGANGAGLIHTWRDGYWTNIQLLPRGAPDIVRNLPLRRVRTLSAGQSTTVSIEPESSLCSDLEDWFILTSRCENVEILVDKAGTLTVDARAMEAGGGVPVVFFATSGEYTRGQERQPGTVSVGVRAGNRYRIFVGIPSGIVAAQRYEVSTSLR